MFISPFNGVLRFWSTLVFGGILTFTWILKKQARMWLVNHQEYLSEKQKVLRPYSIRSIIKWWSGFIIFKL